MRYGRPRARPRRWVLAALDQTCRRGGLTSLFGRLPQNLLLNEGETPGDSLWPAVAGSPHRRRPHFSRGRSRVIRIPQDDGLRRMLTDPRCPERVLTPRPG